MIYIQLIILIALLLICFLLNSKEIVAPSCVYTASFAFASFWAAIYAQKWILKLKINTFATIVGGALLFISVSTLVRKSYEKIQSDKNDNKVGPINIPKMKQILFFIFILTMILASIYYTVKSVDGDFKNIRSTLYKYRNYTTFQEKEVEIPYIINASMGLIHCAAYWFMYVAINNSFYNKKLDYTNLTISIICGISNLIEGNRGGIFNYVLSVIPTFVILKIKYSNGSYKINYKALISVALLGIILLFGLKNSAKLIGRDDVNEINTIDYIAMYAGAEIKNLDTYLNEKNDTIYTCGLSTFNTIIKQTTKIGGVYDKLPDIPNRDKFRTINGYKLGNVYTIYKNFYDDFGYYGIILMTMLIASVTEIIYQECKLNKTKQINIYTLIYSFSFGGIVFSFFSNKLIGQIVSISFLEYIIAWYCMTYFFVKFDIKKYLSIGEKNGTKKYNNS